MIAGATVTRAQCNLEQRAIHTKGRHYRGSKPDSWIRAK